MTTTTMKNYDCEIKLVLDHNSGKPVWLALAEIDDSPEYDADGPDPFSAMTSLAMKLLEELCHVRHEPNTSEDH